MLPKNDKSVSRLSIFYRQVKHKRIRNRFYSKAQCFRAGFSGVSFYNVNFKGAALTNCSFKGADFQQVEFLGSNLKKSNFTNARFKSCVFSAALVKDANFKGCTFEDCIFVNINLDAAKNVFVDSRNNEILTRHPSPAVSDEIIKLLNDLRFDKNIQNSRVLHLKGGKVNGLTLDQLISFLGEESLKQGLLSLQGKLPSRIITAADLCRTIDRAARG